MRIFVTGVGGFVGGELAGFLRAAGHEVGGSASSAASAARLPDWLSAKVVLALGEPVTPAVFAGWDAVVHLAHASGEGAAERNLRGTAAIAAAARTAGVRRWVFVSSYSAHARATSRYGKGKFAIERELAQTVDPALVIVRPGLVLGPGGLFARMVRTLRRLPVVPLPDGGRNAVPIVSSHDCNRALLRLVQDELPTHAADDTPRSFNLAYERRPTLRELMTAMAQDLGLRRAFVPLPLGLLLGPLRVLEALRIPSPIDAENLRGYRQNVADEFTSDLAALGIDAKPELADVLRRLRTTA